MAKKIVSNDQTNVFAILSLIFGIVFFIPFGPILAIVFGFIALSQISKSGEQGRALAITGIVLGFFWIIIILLIIFFILLALGSVLMMLPSLIQ